MYLFNIIFVSRGCPFNCKYCLSATSHGVRFLDIDRVLNDLMYFINKKVRLVKFVDRTFNCNTKFAMAIWDFLIKQDTKTQFHFEVSADILNDEEIKLLANAPNGRFRFEVGVQTTNDDVYEIRPEEIQLVFLKLLKGSSMREDADKG